MSRIRACEPDDLPRVASLFERVGRSRSAKPAPGLAETFARGLFADPWADPEIPSLVLETDGEIAAFVAVYVRRGLFDDEPIRIAVTAQLVSDPALGRRPGGALLLRRALAGPQDLTLSAARGDVTRIWRQLGGDVLPVSSTRWALVFRPARMAGHVALGRLRRRGLEPWVQPALALVDRVAARRAAALGVVVPPAATASEAALRVEELTPAAAVEHLPRLAGSVRLRPDYDEAFLAWVWDEMARVGAPGRVARRLVRGADGRVLGWYVAQLHPTRASQALQVVALEPDVDAVLECLLDEARASGTPALTGRVEPRLVAALWERPCLLRRDDRDLIHSRRPALVAAAKLGEALLTGQEGHLRTLPATQ